ncbi:unnamed protein product [marine sediment metagenome]|uniref:Homeodomain phBC6A51-type domain-containing protein n=3 Tax=marine sediment metagenome TaxID=412755 RepID=X1SD06_9ZZZZ
MSNKINIINEKKIKKAYIQSLKNGTTRVEAREAADVAEGTIWNWRKKDEEFAKAEKEALESRIEIVEDALYSEAKGAGRGSIIAKIFWLKNRGKGRWRDKYEHEIKMPKIVNQQIFIQAGEEPVIEEEPGPKEEKEESTGG